MSVIEKYIGPTGPISIYGFHTVGANTVPGIAFTIYSLQTVGYRITKTAHK